MLTFIFFILMILIFGRLIGFAFRFTWGVLKVVFMLFVLPILLIGLFIGGLIYVAFPILVVVGIIALIASIAKKA